MFTFNIGWSDQPLSALDESEPTDAAGVRDRKRKQADTKAPAPINFIAVKKYQPLLFAGFLGPHNIVAMERPWLSIMAAFPPALYRSRYGM